MVATGPTALHCTGYCAGNTRKWDAETTPVQIQIVLVVVIWLLWISYSVSARQFKSQSAEEGGNFRNVHCKDPTYFIYLFNNFIGFVNKCVLLTGSLLTLMGDAVQDTDENREDLQKIWL